MQTAFFLIPAFFVVSFNTFVRPFFYILLFGAVFLTLGNNYRRSAKMAYQANMIAILSIGIFAAAIIGISYLFGGGQNARVVSVNGFIIDLWSVGLPLILAEIMRYKLIKAAGNRHRVFIIMALLVVYAFANLNEIRTFNFTDGQSLHFLFASALPAVTASAVVSYVAVRGTVFATVVVSFVYNLGTVFSPILPDLDRLVWGLVLCGLLFIIGLLFSLLADDTTAAQRRRIRRAAKYESSKGLKTAFSLIASGFIIAFFLQVFTIYPVVILTGSMTGYIDRGSLVIMQRIPQDEVLHRVQVGDVLHYHFRGMEFVHRVVDFAYDDLDSRMYVTQGDANPYPDPLPLPQQDVIGRPLLTIPYIGYPNIVMQAILRL